MIFALQLKENSNSKPPFTFTFHPKKQHPNKNRIFAKKYPPALRF